MLTFGERLKKARERKGLTQNEVYKLIGITDKSLSRYETNSSAPDPETILELIRLYDVSSDFIMGISSIMGNADLASGTSKAAPAIIMDPSILENLDGLSEEAIKKAADYIEMLKTLEAVEQKNKYRILKMAARNGSFEEKAVTDSDVKNIKDLPDVDDLK